MAAITLEEMETIVADLQRMIFSGVTSMSIDGRTYSSFSSMKDLERALALAKEQLRELQGLPKTKVPMRQVYLGAGCPPLFYPAINQQPLN